MKIFAFILMCLFAGLQYRLWVADGGFPEVVHLRAKVEAQQKENAEIAIQNSVLETRILGLKHDSDQVEGRARADLGLVMPDETFYRVTLDDE